jgi:succinate dehydrogenase/fumarate reductase cytochrome b subunit (b558 family)
VAKRASSADRRRFILRKLHSLSGVVPLGLFVVLHLWTQAHGLWGQARYDEAIADRNAIPYLPLIEVGLVLLPLAFHGLFGVFLALQSRANVGAYPFNRNWMYVAQRLSGVAGLAFIVWHVGQYWLPKYQGQLSPAELYPALCADLSATHGGVPLIALAYILGVAATVFHLANGLWGFCVSWGIVVTRNAQRLSATVFGLGGLLLFFLGANTAIYFATGSRVAVFGVPVGSHETLARTCSDLTTAAPAGQPAGLGK